MVGWNLVALVGVLPGGTAWRNLFRVPVSSSAGRLRVHGIPVLLARPGLYGGGVACWARDVGVRGEETVDGIASGGAQAYDAVAGIAWKRIGERTRVAGPGK